VNDDEIREALNHPERHDPKVHLKRKLCAAIDQLGDADGFVLVATTDDLSFTRLRSAGWDERTLELEPLQAADARQEASRLRDECVAARGMKAALEREIAAKEQQLADATRVLAIAEAAVARAVGGEGVKS
jgi:hypothetical protein